MTLAKRVRDCRYAKGWGPDELANRAQISRTALYQIECGKTETPRAGTLRRIAQALEIPINALIADADVLGLDTPAAEAPTLPVEDRRVSMFRGRERAYSSLEALDIIDAGQDAGPRPKLARQRELARKFHELLASPLGEGVARIVEETYRLLPAWRSKQSV
jgi:transcriptional regulator with XRE-family HTH domain